VLAGSVMPKPGSDVLRGVRSNSCLHVLRRPSPW
jgi:hypothetical protein